MNEALTSALNTLLVLLLESEFGIRESFESAIAHDATSQMLTCKILKVVVIDSAVFAPIAKFAEEAVKNGRFRKIIGVHGSLSIHAIGICLLV